MIRKMLSCVPIALIASALPIPSSAATSSILAPKQWVLDQLVVSNASDFVTSNTNSIAYKAAHGGGGGGADTNAVNDLIHNYDVTNLTRRFDAKVTAAYSWMRPDDWTISYIASNITQTSVDQYAETDSSYRVISNITTTITQGRGGTAYLTMLDPNSSEKSPIESFFAVDSGITIDATSGAFCTISDGLFKVGARRAGELRYADVSSQIIGKTEQNTITFYADDVAGSRRKAVNDAALAILNAAPFVQSNQYVGAGGVVHEYAVYRTFQPRMTTTGAGNVAPFAVSQHVLASCKHYGEWQRWLWDQKFDDGNGNSATIKKIEWVDVAAWARTNNFTEAEIAYADIADLMLIRCSKATAVPNGCIPYFMNELAMKNRFGESMRGVCAWSHVQDMTNAVPVVMENENTMKASPWYYNKYKDPTTGHVGFSRADVCRRLEQMGLQYYVHGGDSGKPVFVTIDGNPVILTNWAYGTEQCGFGANFVRGYNIIKAFVTAYGDTLKGIEQ